MFQSAISISRNASTMRSACDWFLTTPTTAFMRGSSLSRALGMYEQSGCQSRHMHCTFRTSVGGMRPSAPLRRPTSDASRTVGLAVLSRGRRASPARALSMFRDVTLVRRAVALVALVLGAYCLITAAVLSAQPAPGHPDPSELAARERYRWPGWIPIVFLVLIVLYAVAIVARRRRRDRSRLPSTQDPPPVTPIEPARRNDTTSR